MRQIKKTTTIPDLLAPGVRDADDELSSEARAEFGRAAVELGTPDRGRNDDRTDAVDAIANVMHWVKGLDLDPRACLDAAARHFEAEIETVEEQAVGILLEAGIAAHLQHSGGGIWVAEVGSDEIPGRTVWIGDSEGEQGGPYFVSVFTSAPPAEEIAALSGACRATQLPARVRRGLSQREADSPELEQEGGEGDAR